MSKIFFEFCSKTLFRTPGDDSCYRHHAGYEEFANQVRDGIERGLNNDIYTYSRRPGTVTNGALRRKDQFRVWFTNIFDVWYQDVTEASDWGTRKCLTDNFPYDSPGNLDKECVPNAQVKCQSLAVSMHTLRSALVYPCIL